MKQTLRITAESPDPHIATLFVYLRAELRELIQNNALFKSIRCKMRIIDNDDFGTIEYEEED